MVVTAADYHIIRWKVMPRHNIIYTTQHSIVALEEKACSFHNNNTNQDCHCTHAVTHVRVETTHERIRKSITLLLKI